MDNEEVMVGVVDIDLNEEPTESSWNYQEAVNDMDEVYTRIEERIRRLEAVTLRAQHRQERRLSREPVNEEALSLNEEIERAEVTVLPGVAINPVPDESLDGLKSSGSHLLELALGLESDGDVQVKKNSGEGFFDCNVCLGKARDPILTCCGHLYCWRCFYVLPDVALNTKECPACKGEVSDAGITPIYGSSDKTIKTDVDKSGVIIPPRPRANRIESLRQQRITRGSHSLRIEEVLRSLHSISTLNGSISSALSSAERLTNDLEGIAYLYHPAGHRNRDVVETDINSEILVDVPFEAVVPDDNVDTVADFPSSSTPTIANGTTSASNGMQHDAAVSLRRRVRPRYIPRSRRGMLQRSPEQAQLLQLSIAEQQEQRRSSLRSRTELEARILSLYGGVFEPEENSPNALPQMDNPELLPVSATPETNALASSSIRSREDVLNTSEASDSVTPEPRRRRRR
ncbi:unnamed protein product [Rhodiola kirilowii]